MAPRVTPPLTRVCAQTQGPFFYRESELVDQIHDLSPLELTAPDITTKSGDEFTLTATVYNPNDISVENVQARLSSPALYQKFLPLHVSPRWYSLFNLIPVEPIDREMKWRETISDRFRLNPKESKTIELQGVTPLIRPQTLSAFAEAFVGEVPAGKKPISIKVETDSFVIAHERGERNTDVMVLIDNRGGKAKRVDIEADFNQGLSTQFVEVYTVKVPADDVAIYGYNYRVKLMYDTLLGRYRGQVREAK